MSRGPGRWQRVILDHMDNNPQYKAATLDSIVREHLQRTPTRSEMVAARRALKTLAIAGKVRAIYHPGAKGDRPNLVGGLCVTTLDARTISRYRHNTPDWITVVEGMTQAEATGCSRR